MIKRAHTIRQLFHSDLYSDLNGIPKMLKVVLLVAAVASLAQGCTYKSNRECPDYTVIEQHPDYEIRSYPGITWVTTTVQSRMRRVAQYNAFMRLFRYISGNNDKDQKIEMTVPVLMKFDETENSTALQMRFFVPSQFAADPPVPLEEHVTVLREEPTVYAVRSFPGYVWRTGRWTEEARKLSDSLKDDDRFDKTSYYQVGYDAPFVLLDRRNEVWMVKKTDGAESNDI